MKKNAGIFFQKSAFLEEATTDLCKTDFGLFQINFWVQHFLLTFAEKISDLGNFAGRINPWAKLVTFCNMQSLSVPPLTTPMLFFNLNKNFFNRT